MREQLQDRLEELRRELEKGQAELEKVESQRAYLRDTILRIAGAVQVLEELLSTTDLDGGDRSSPETTALRADGKPEVGVGSGHP